MKFLIRLLGLLFALAILLTIIAFLLPRNQHVERSLQIDAPAAVIQPFLTTPKQFNRWSPWATIDPDGTRYSYSGPETGVGAKMAWTSEHPDVGTGTQEITAVSNDRVDVTLDFGPMGLAQAYYVLEPNDNGTKITWGFDKDMGNNPAFRWFGTMLEKRVGADYERGLQNLNSVTMKAHEEILEAKAAAQKKAVMERAPEVSLVSTKPATILFTSGQSEANSEAIGAALAPAFGALMEFMQANNLEMASMPLAINEEYNPETNIYRFKAGIPIDSDDAATITTTDSIKIEELYSGDAVMAKHIGDYSTLPGTYDMIDLFITDNKLLKNGSSWEHYVTDPTTVAPEEVVTLIYQPVQKTESSTAPQIN